MINKFELVGILASTALMAIALFLMRVESLNFVFTENAENNLAAVTVVTENDNNNLKDTLKDSIDRKGQLLNLVIDDIAIGTGAAVEPGDRITVNYIGTLANGQEFDNSYLSGKPFTFKQGEGRVIAGWEEGVLGMKVGGKRILVIPAELGYGDRAVGPIPANSTLVFAIELLSINE